MAEFLTKILVETNQPVPDFLSEFAPPEGELDFDDDSAGEEEAETAGEDSEGGAWGNDTGNIEAATTGDGWGNAASNAEAQASW